MELVVLNLDLDENRILTQFGDTVEVTSPYPRATEEDVWNFFAYCGEVKHVEIVSPGEAVPMTQEVVKTMIAKGYGLGKDSLIKAKAFDESHHVSATAAAKVAELSKKIGLTDKIKSSMETLKNVDEKYHVSEITKSAASITGTAAILTGRIAAAAANAFVNSRFFAAGALWVSDVLTCAAKFAADMGTRPKE